MQDIPLPTDYLGLMTQVDPLKVPDGFLYRGQNIRNDDGTTSLRGGITSVKASGQSGTYVGGGLFEWSGDIYYFFGMDDSGVTVYWAKYSSSSWGSVAAVSGNYSVSTITAPDSGFLTFTGVPGDLGTAYVVVQNGIDDPLVITMAATPTVAPNEAIPSPDQLDGKRPVFTITDFLNLDSTSSSNGGGAGTLAWSGSGSTWTLTTGAGANVDGDTANFDVTDTMDLSGGGQQIFLVGTESDSSIFQCTKWELDMSVTDITLHDPENGIDNMVVVPTNIPGLNVYAFPLGEYASTERLPDSGSPGAVLGLKVTLTNVDIAANTTFELVGLFLGGYVPGTAQYALSWENTGTQGESPSVVLQNPTKGIGVAQLLGGVSSDLPTDFELPISPALRYRVLVPTIAPDSDEKDLGVDYINIYRKDPDDAYFYLAKAKQAASYSGGWGYVAPYTSSREALHTDVTEPWNKDTVKTAPGAYVEPVPIGQAGAFSGDRMYFANRGSSTSRPSVKVSDKKFPFRFRTLPISGEEGLEGFEVVLDGDREVTAIVPGSSSTVGASGVFVFTKRGIYTVDDIFVAKIASAGCLGATADEDANVWFFDKDKQVRVLAGSIPNLSRYTVHDKFSGVTDPSVMSFARYQGRLYCLVSGTRVMVWSDRLGQWESEDVPDENLVPSQFHKWDFLGESKLYVSMTDGDLCEYEQGTTDGGAQISMGITWKEMSQPDWKQVRIGWPYLVCTDKASETASFAFTAKNPAGTQTATISLDAPSGETVQWTKGAATGKEVAVAGCSVLPKLDLTVAGPFVLYGVTVKGATGGRGARA